MISKLKDKINTSKLVKKKRDELELEIKKLNMIINDKDEDINKYREINK